MVDSEHPIDDGEAPRADAGHTCSSLRDEIPHVLLGEAGAALARACRAHVLGCADCRAEWDATAQVLQVVRAASARAASAGFRDRIASRVADERVEEDERLMLSASLIGRVVAGAAFVRFRVMQSLPLKIVLSVAALQLFALGAWWYFERPEPSSPSEVATAPSGLPSGTVNPGVETPVVREPDVIVESPLVKEGEQIVEGEPDPLDYIDPPAERWSTEVEDPEPSLFQPGFERELSEAISHENLFARARHQMRLRLNPKDNGLTSRTRTEADKAALRGMRFLIEQQEEDGSWDPAAFGGEGYARVGVTGLCLAALSVDAGIPNDLQKKALTAGHAYLRSTLHRDTMTFGGVVRGLSEAGDVTLFNHALATLALSEQYVLFGRSGHASRPAGEGIEEILNEALVRLDDLGRQRFLRDLDEEDTTTAPWVALALETARASGLRTRAVNLTDASFQARRFVANKLTDRPTDAQLWAAVTVSGVDPLFDGELSANVYLPPLDRMLPHLKNPALREPTKIFFASLDFHQRGGDDWERWRTAAEAVLMSGQHEDGSWESEYTWDRVQQAGGELYATALSVMTLSVSYRHAH